MDAGLALGLFALALSVGIYGSIIGAGGGFIMVAALVLLFDLSGAEAVGTSVLTILFVQLSGAINYNRAGMVDRPVAKWFIVGSVPTAFVSAAVVANRIPERAFDLIIGALLLGLAIFVIVSKPREGDESAPLAPRIPHLVSTGTVVGALGGSFGVGAGLMTVPAIRSLQQVTTHRAAATTTAIGAASGAASGLGHILAGNPKWSYVPFVIAGAIAGGRIGSSSAGRLSQTSVSMLLAIGLIAAGAPLLLRGV